MVEKWLKNELFYCPCKLFVFKELQKVVSKGCLVRFQKGVTWTSKGHLLQANWALFASRLVVFTKSIYEKYGQNSVCGGLE